MSAAICGPSRPPASTRLEGADVTHAWVAVWCGDELGWIGFDPTNAILAQNDHIVLALRAGTIPT